MDETGSTRIHADTNHPHASKIRTLQVDTYTVDELATLYQYATGLERLLLLLGLNCGFGQAEIASLQVEEIHLEQKHPHYGLEGSWIMRLRPKTGIYGEWKLWDETVQAIRWMMERRSGHKDGALLLVIYQRKWPRGRVSDGLLQGG